MKKILAIVLGVIIVVVGILACSPSSEEDLTNIGEYNGCKLELKEAEKFNDDDGRSLVRVYATYTNDNEDPLYALCSFAVRCFQNDIELTERSEMYDDIDKLVTEVKNGKSIDVSFVYELEDESEVEVLIGTPTADMETIGTKIYFTEE